MQKRKTSRELAYRAGDGVEVSLSWSEADNRLTVTVSDTKAGGAFELIAHPENALDVFYHPFAYAAFQGLDYAVSDSSWASAEALAA